MGGFLCWCLVSTRFFRISHVHRKKKFKYSISESGGSNKLIVASQVRQHNKLVFVEGGVRQIGLSFPHTRQYNHAVFAVEFGSIRCVGVC